jgi:O-methyltransferase
MALRLEDIPDRHLYAPRLSPWLGEPTFRSFDESCDGLTLTAPDSRHALYTLTRQALALDGEIWECGVFKGGTARLLASVIAAQSPRVLRLFDTFEGSPPIDRDFDVRYPKRDVTTDGEREELSESAVRRRLGGYDFVEFHRGLMPASFAGLEQSRIALAHVDVDLYQGVRGCCEFIYPRLAPGGIMVFDDYGFASCPGARRAVDEFFADKPEFPLVSPSAQALVFKLPG